VFVTLRRHGRLRGCIGNVLGTEPLYRGVSSNALHAAFADPRFPALGRDELGDIEIEISVMTPLRRAADHRAIRLGRDGVLIRDGNAQALFLPQVASETGWTLDEFLEQLCLKAGLPRSAWRTSRSMQFHVFQAQVFHEGDPGQ
jgi:AmmeMemoRadiSam system protein A